MKRIVLMSLYAILLILIFGGLPDSVVYTQQRFLYWLPFIMVFGFQTILVYSIARTFSVNTKRSVGIAVLAVLITGPLCGMYFGKKQEKELSKNGKVTIGVIDKKWENEGNKGHEWLFRCSFKVNGVNYSTFTEEDKNNIYHIGDTLHILYSKDIPTNCVIVELKDK